VDISVVDACFRVEICTPIFLGDASKSYGWQIIFEKNSKTQLDTSLNKAQHKQELLCGKIFDSGRNVYGVEEPFYFHLTLINLKIKVQQN
jgi:hypothetical protein